MKTEINLDIEENSPFQEGIRSEFRFKDRISHFFKKPENSRKLELRRHKPRQPCTQIFTQTSRH